ncbi:YggS family pyridoxal phosphate-dependent enzyme [Galactobacter caseinivorans]|uniref:Pyridoxal phosphate homeostasis protein n=1 Tax=Galactobacter caseinivorans TaxID=2676123 RepID=A0A496PMH7_9MICC|nr:YggS family pyridoxal phosphate-dependent enzyme [Galactobacter caseinivorans]RKW71669.1 YggS family pyridoxal phosphate-dependent enzyme [Galactobacter caseinivorans]
MSQPLQSQITEERAAELRRRLSGVEQRIQAATAASGRTEAPGLIVVTKFFPASDVLALTRLGVDQVGENREQEAGPKAAELAEAGARPHWHFIGQLQSNKAARVVRFAQSVHSVDRVGLVNALERAMARRAESEPVEAPLGCYLQLDLRTQASREQNPDAPRGGAEPGEMIRLADAVAGSAHLRLEGLMAVAPLGEDPAPAFERLALLSSALRERHPGAVQISAGMSGDLEAAVAAGATRLRIGSDVLGRRPGLR